MNVRAFTVLAAVVAVVGLAITWALYGGGALWPGLVGNFVASLIAFLLALTWDRRQRAQAQSESRDREAKQAEAVLKDEDERR